MDNRILIIGNGFDIAHGLPTRYGDFIEFLAAFESLYDTYALKNQKLTDEEFNSIKTEKLNFKLTKMLHALFVCGRYVYHPNGMLSVDDPILSRLYDVINSNAWFEYFYALYEKKKMKGLNWIDFEAEMSEIIRWIDGTSLQLDDDFDIVVDTLFGNATDEKKTQFQGMIASHCGANYYEELIDELYSELEKLIEALDIYLSAFVETLPIDKKSIISAIDPEFVISFNYTHTFSKLYNQQIPICYIHGETGHYGRNMVLGIDEYLYGDDRDEKTNMSIFKKFVQRIRNRNDIVYKSWSDSWEKEYMDYLERKKVGFNISTQPQFEVYIYGHSLGVTDKDILYSFLYPEYTKLNIYAYGKTEEGKLISRLIKIIGEDRLIEKSNSYPRKVTFEDCSN